MKEGEVRKKEKREGDRKERKNGGIERGSGRKKTGGRGEGK